MWLVIRAGTDRGRQVEVTGDRLIIGRDPRSDLVLNEPAASRQHAVLERAADGSVLVRDLGSTNGTFVNGERISAPRTLEPGDQVQIGDTVMLASTHEPSGPVTTSRPVMAAPPPTGPGPATTERMVLRRGIRRATMLAIGATLVAVAVVALFLTGVLPPGADVNDVVKQVEPSTVVVLAKAGGEARGSGTGWVLDASQGLIVTNHHVVNGGTEWAVSVDGRERPARLIGTAPCDDLAVLQVADASGLETLPLGSQGELEQGDTVVAIGYPGASSLEATLTATEGIVSVVRTRWDLPGLDVPRYPNVIQTDAAINPGNSGGPLVNLDAQLVGVNSAGITLLGGRIIQGQGYAIGVDRVKQVVPFLRTGKSLAWTGAMFDYPTQESDLTDLGLPPVRGLIVRGAVPGTPAEAAGLGQGPALITAVNGTEMDGTLPGYCSVVASAQSGESATFTVITAGSEQPQDVDIRFA